MAAGPLRGAQELSSSKRRPTLFFSRLLFNPSVGPAPLGVACFLACYECFISSVPCISALLTLLRNELDRMAPRNKETLYFTLKIKTRKEVHKKMTISTKQGTTQTTPYSTLTTTTCPLRFLGENCCLLGGMGAAGLWERTPHTYILA